MATRVPSVRIYERAPARFSVIWTEHRRQHEERGYESRIEAEDRAQEIRKRLRQRLSGVRAPCTIGDIAARWWDEYVGAGKVEASTRAGYGTAMRRILADLGTRDAHSVTTPQLIEWHAAMNVKPRSANATLTALSSMMQRGVEWGMLDANPCRGVKRHKEVIGTVHIPTAAEIMRLGMTATSDRERGMLLVACYAGLRHGELRALRVSDLYHGRIRVQTAMGADGKRKPPKTNEERVVPIPVSVREWLTAYTRGMKPTATMFPNPYGKPIEPSRWRREVWNPWASEADCDHLLWRHLRHYYASTVAAVGGSMLQCSRWMGHASITTTMDRYGFLFDRDEDRVMSALEQR